MPPKAKPIPDGFHSVSPYLVVHDAAAALDFYARAFGAKELFRMPGPGGKVMHAEMQLGDSRILLSDESPEMGSRSPRTLKGSAVGLLVYTEDVDALHARALAAGAQAKAPPADMFWGDRWCALVDPFGHEWQLATHKEDLTPEEMAKRAAAAMA
jgi:PhnB protein